MMTEEENTNLALPIELVQNDAYIHPAAKETVNSEFDFNSIPLIDKEDSGEKVSSNGILSHNTVDVAEKRTTAIFKDVFDTFRGNGDAKKKQKLRNEINDTFILNTGTQITDDNVEELLNRGDFFTARRIWDKSERKFHDHFAFVKER